MLNTGDKIWLSGGYDMEPAWLRGGDGYSAMVVGFDVSWEYVVARFESKIKFEGIENDWAILFFTFKDAVWDDKNTIRVALCKIIPPADKEISEEWLIKNTVLMEAYATYSKI